MDRPGKIDKNMNTLDQPKVSDSISKSESNSNDNSSAKPLVNGQGQRIDAESIKNRSLTLTSGNTFKQKASYLAAIHQNQAGVGLRPAAVKLRKVPEEKKSTEQSESSSTIFSTAAQYLANASWKTYKEKLNKKVIESGGKNTNNEDLNQLMKKHAEYANKTGGIDAVLSDIDAEGKFRKPGTISKSKYEVYVLGREQIYDKTNDFKQNIDGFLDSYLNELLKKASEDNSNLKDIMDKRFGITSVVPTPQEFFYENTDLLKQLNKTGLKIQWLSPDDITEPFIDALIHFDEVPGKLAPIVKPIYDRHRKKLQAKLTELELNSKEVLKRCGEQ